MAALLALLLAGLSTAWLVAPQSMGAALFGITLMNDTPGAGLLLGVSGWMTAFAALQISQVDAVGPPPPPPPPGRAQAPSLLNMVPVLHVRVH